MTTESKSECEPSSEFYFFQTTDTSNDLPSYYVLDTSSMKVSGKVLQTVLERSQYLVLETVLEFLKHSGTITNKLRVEEVDVWGLPVAKSQKSQSELLSPKRVLFKKTNSIEYDYSHLFSAPLNYCSKPMNTFREELPTVGRLDYDELCEYLNYDKLNEYSQIKMKRDALKETLKAINTQVEESKENFHELLHRATTTNFRPLGDKGSAILNEKYELTNLNDSNDTELKIPAKLILNFSYFRSKDSTLHHNHVEFYNLLDGDRANIDIIIIDENGEGLLLNTDISTDASVLGQDRILFSSCRAVDTIYSARSKTTKEKFMKKHDLLETDLCGVYHFDLTLAFDELCGPLLTGSTKKLEDLDKGVLNTLRIRLRDRIREQTGVKL